MRYPKKKVESCTNPIKTIFFFNFKAGGSSGILMDLAANEKDVHADFFNGKKNYINFKMH